MLVVPLRTKVTGQTLPHFHFRKLHSVAQRSLSGEGRVASREVMEDDEEVPIQEHFCIAKSNVC